VTQDRSDAHPLAGIPAREALERTGVGLAIADAEGNLVLVSPAIQDTFRVGARARAGELAAGWGLQRDDGTPLAGSDTPLVRAGRGEFVKDFVLGAYNSSGELTWFRCNAGPLRDAHGRPHGSFVIAQDVTAQRRSEESREALRQRLVHTVDHEFRTPLAALLGHLELLRDHRGQLPERLTRALDDIERSGWQLRDLVEKVAGLIEEQDELQRSRVPLV
jgi:signal transduction histidine kinase